MIASSVAAIVFANSQDEFLGKLTKYRSMASVPFGGRYRLIDFSLSNLVNSGISNVGIITKENYRSLMDHVGSGIFWDLDRKNGGIRILPPYSSSGVRRYQGYVEALNGARDFIRRSHAEYIVICDSSVVANVDIGAALDMHIANAADVTLVYHKGTCPKKCSDTMRLSFDENKRVTNIVFSGDDEDVDYDLGIMIIGCSLLTELVEKSYNSEEISINRDILAGNISKLKIYGYKHEGFAAIMESERTYFDSNMRLLDSEVRHDLFNKERPIYTKTRDDMPTRYGTRAVVENSLIADGCVIDGVVKNSVLFRGVQIEKGAIVENSILMQGVCVAENAQLSYVISDKNAVVGSGMQLKGTVDKAFLVKKNQTV